MTKTNQYVDQFDIAAREIVQSGVKATSHHATIKKAFRDRGITDTALESLREMLVTAEHDIADVETKLDSPEGKKAVKRVKAKIKAAKGPKASQKETLAQARSRGGNWSLVRAITEHGNKGQPKRVDIECVICGGTRNIATQDVFQVSTCSKECKRAQKQAAREDAHNDADKS